jgi:SSS family transporter
MLSPLDYVVLASYLALVAAIGLWAGRGQKSTKDYFLGGRAIPWWAAGLSILATETSVLTFIGVPTQSLRGDWTYLQLAFGSALARLVVAWVLIPAYYKAKVVTVYDYLARRFGAMSRNLASALFLVGRVLGSGVRLYGAAIALVLVTDLGFPAAIAAIATVAALYTLLGGLRSVVWTDVLQGAMLVGGAIISIVFLLKGTGLGVSEAMARLAASTTDAGHSKLRLLDLSLDPRLSYTLFAGLIGSGLLTLSTHGTDQDMIQRALACRESKGGSRSLILSSLLVLPVAALFLAVGSLLWLQFGGDAGAAALAEQLAVEKGLADPGRAFDFLFPLYVIQTLPVGVKGLIIAAIFATAMSSLDSAISALSTTAVRSVWEPYVMPGRKDSHYLRVARIFSVLFALLLVAVALAVWSSEGAGDVRQGFGVLALGLKVLTWIFPPLLGVFLVGTLTRRGSDASNVFAICVGVAVLLFFELWPQLFGVEQPFAWIWNPVVGAGVTFVLAVAHPGPLEST